jgi:YD repeat-containing protein
MKASYDPKTDTLTVELKPGPVAESDEQKPGVILDYDADGNLVSIEVLDASKRVAQVQSMQFQVAG